jgi:asparagine synthase (glutamine-hydrolysing)
MSCSPVTTGTCGAALFFFHFFFFYPPPPNAVFFSGAKLHESAAKKPLRVRGTGLAPLSRVPSQFWSGMRGPVPWHGPAPARTSAAKLQKAFRLAASAGSFDEVYLQAFPRRSGARSRPRGSARTGRDAAFDLAVGGDRARCGADDVLRLGSATCPTTSLAKVDRAFDGGSARRPGLPFLDHRVARASAARIPQHLKNHGRAREADPAPPSRGPYVPRELVERPKAGLRNPRRCVDQGARFGQWAEDLLDPGAMRADGWFDPDIVQRRWRDHLRRTPRFRTPRDLGRPDFHPWLRAQHCPRLSGLCPHISFIPFANGRTGDREGRRRELHSMLVRRAGRGRGRGGRLER